MQNIQLLIQTVEKHRKIKDRTVKLATSSQLLEAGYLFWEKFATSSQLLVSHREKLATSRQLLVSGYLIWRKLHVATSSQLHYNYRKLCNAYKICYVGLYQIFADITLNLVSYYQYTGFFQKSGI